jgi:hypothetical protein
MELGDIAAAAVTLTARVAVVDPLAYVDERQSGVVAELPSGPQAQYARIELVSAVQLAGPPVEFAVAVSTAVDPTPRFRISHVTVWPDPEPPSAPPVDDTYVSPAPSVCSTHTALATAGPLFVTRISHVTLPPHGIG